MNDIPTRIYKYRKWNAFTQRIFTHNELYFACPLDFNDPFDCKLTPPLVGTDEQWKIYLARLLSKRYPERSSEDITKEATRLVIEGKYKTEEFQNAHRLDMVARQAKAGVLSLSSRRDSLLMWSHYADNHRGICVEFSHGDDNGFLGLPVSYKPSLPELSIADPDYKDKLLKYSLLTKFEEWHYEDEYRIILPQFHGPKVFPTESLIGVILGCQIPDDQRDEVIGIVSDTHPRATIFQARMRIDAFKIEIVPIQSPRLTWRQT